MSIKQVSYAGWTRCWHIADGGVEVIILADVGPRIIHLSLAGSENELYQVAADAGQMSGTDFRMYGGHRLWTAPEGASTAYPDNQPVDVEALPHGATFTSRVENTGLQKQVTVKVRNNSRVEVIHRIANRSDHPIHLAPWALTVMRPGGRVILPLPPRAPHGPEHLLPTASLALWSYTDLTAACWRLGPKYLQLDQRFVADPGFGMQKIGLRNPAGWGCYLREGHLFIKAIRWREASYPDFGSNFETFATEKFIELETLAFEVTLPPGESVEHVELWGLWQDIAASQVGFMDAGIIDKEILPRAEALVREF